MTDFPPLPRYLTLDEAAQAMTDRTGKSWTARQILGCAERHEITVFARIGHAVKFVRVRPIEGKTNEIAAEAGSLPILDTKAIQALLLTGEARSRGWEELTTIDFFGEPAQAWTTVFELAPGEQAPRVRADDCRVTANGVLRLVESYTDPAPAEPSIQRRARLLAELEAEQAIQSRGALQRIADRHGIDRSNLGKDIQKAKAERAENRRAGTWANHLVRDGKRTT